MNTRFTFWKIVATLGVLLSGVGIQALLVIYLSPVFMLHTSFLWVSVAVCLLVIKNLQNEQECIEIGDDKPISIKVKIKSGKPFPKTTTHASSTRKSATTSKF